MLETKPFKYFSKGATAPKDRNVLVFNNDGATTQGIDLNYLSAEVVTSLQESATKLQEAIKKRPDLANLSYNGLYDFLKKETDGQDVDGDLADIQDAMAQFHSASAASIKIAYRRYTNSGILT